MAKVRKHQTGSNGFTAEERQQIEEAVALVEDFRQSLPPHYFTYSRLNVEDLLSAAEAICEYSINVTGTGQVYAPDGRELSAEEVEDFRNRIKRLIVELDRVAIDSESKAMRERAATASKTFVRFYQRQMTIADERKTNNPLLAELSQRSELSRVYDFLKAMKRDRGDRIIWTGKKSKLAWLLRRYFDSIGSVDWTIAPLYFVYNDGREVGSRKLSQLASEIANPERAHVKIPDDIDRLFL